jgi:hypothetical protein
VDRTFVNADLLASLDSAMKGTGALKAVIPPSTFNFDADARAVQFLMKVQLDGRDLLGSQLYQATLFQLPGSAWRIQSLRPRS